MTNRNLGVYILFKADTAGAKAGAAEVKQAIGGVTAATNEQARASDRTASAKSREAQATRELAEAERRARDAAIAAVTGANARANATQAVARPAQSSLAAVGATGPLAAASREAAAGVLSLDRAMQSSAVASANLGAQLARSAAAMSAATGPSNQFSQSLRAQTAALVEEQQSLRLYQDGLDQLRARYNPLFAASRSYEQELRSIAEAERLGAISAREAAAAREQAAQAMLAPRAPGSSGNGPQASQGAATAYTANLGFQANDIMMMTTLGQSPFALAMQQGPQVVQIFGQMQAAGMAIGPAVKSSIMSLLNPMALATIAAIAFGAAAVQAIASVLPQAKTLEERMDLLDAAFNRYKATAETARASAFDLARQFGTGATQAQGLYEVLSRLSRLSLDQQLKNTATAARELIGLDKIGRDRNLTSFFDLGGGLIATSNYRTEIDQFKGALKGFETAQGVDAQTAALQTILNQVETLSQMKGGISTQEQKLIDLLKEQADVLLGIKSVETARDAARALQISRMQLESTQQAELSEAELRFGANSIEIEQLKADHAREALALRLQEMGVAKGGTEEGRARLSLERQLRAEQAAGADARFKVHRDMTTELVQQAELTAAIIVHGEESAAVDQVRAQHARALYELRLLDLKVTSDQHKELMGLFDKEARLQELLRKQTEGRRVGQMMSEMRDQAAINAAMVAFGRDSLRVKELEIAAERRLYEESIRTLGVAERKKLMAEWEATNGLASADPFGLREAMRDSDRSYGVDLGRMQLELQLVTASSAARNRALAVYEAEVEARQKGFEAGSREMEQLKARAGAMADLTTELERQRDAWDKVTQAAEGMIDGPIDALLNGDVKGALASFAQEFMGLYAELAWKNPLKNRLLGTTYSTLDDVGGIGGIFSRFLGGNDAPQAVSSPALQAASAMTVTTPMVHISTSGLSGLPIAAGLQPAANMPFAPGGTGAQAALAAVATGGATRANALTGLQGGFAGALAAMVTEAQRVFGDGAIKVTSAFRDIQRQQELWTEALAKYGSEAAARKWVAPPGSSNHNHGLAADLQFGPGVQQWAHQNAARFGLGFRMSHEPWHVEPAKGAQLPSAEIERFASTAETAASQLGGFGARAETTATGLAQIGGTFAQVLQMFGASKGPGGAIAATLLGGVFKAIGIPGFSTGGWTGAGDPQQVAGLVHAEEFVFDAASTRRIGLTNLEAIRRGAMPGYAKGGYVTGGAPPISPARQAAMAEAAPQTEQRHLFEISVAGTGNAEIASGVQAAISHAFDEFVRNQMPGQVRMIVKDDWLN